ncbi:MAG: topoisomerase DNA-binding C4 zinc finger domain-containing protein [Phycisphaeraceae bacterium]|nr:topoisomerase DNA-binding C4 zinc finger domain-containing protein [Phycisphaeraceae bacterium]
MPPLPICTSSTGLRLVDPKRPEHGGALSVARVDHLVLHRFGRFIAEHQLVTGILHLASSKPQPPTPNAPPVPSKPADATPHCPRCGSAMVRRVARQGPNAGGAFLGCSRYPACKATLRAPGEG